LSETYPFRNTGGGREGPPVIPRLQKTESGAMPLDNHANGDYGTSIKPIR